MNNMIVRDYSEKFCISGRILHGKLEIKTDYRHWFPRVVEYGFTEGQDFNTVKNDRVQNEGNREVMREIIDHTLTLDMAKHLCMIQRTPIGMQMRNKLIEIENSWNSPERVLARALQISQRINEDMKLKLDANEGTIKQLETKVKEDAQKVLFAECVTTANTCILINELAKYLNQNGVAVGQNRLFQYLREDGFLCKAKGELFNLPTQKSLDLKVLNIKESSILQNGEILTRRTPVVTGKGQLYLLNCYIKKLGRKGA